MKNMKVLALGLLALSIGVGCSVQNRNVDNQPPMIKRDLVTFDTDFGTMEPKVMPETVSIFFWPDGLTEEQAVTTVRTVNAASESLDKIVSEIVSMSVEKLTLEGKFEASECVAKWADLDEDEDPEFVDWVAKWKTSNEASEQTAIQACATNQDRRRELLKALDAKANKEQPLIAGVIYKAIDPGYPTKIENMFSVATKGSRLAIKPSEAGGVTVEVTLKDFPRKGLTASNAPNSPLPVLGANYILSRKLLVFAVPEIGTDGKPTGAAYQFAMERAPNYLNMARFKGDMKLVREGVVLRYGSAKIDAVMKP